MPYTPVVVPINKNEWNRWIEGMPNDLGSHRDKKEIFVCASHFEM